MLIQLDEPDEAATRARTRAISGLLESERPRFLADFSFAFDKVLLEFRANEDAGELAAGLVRRFAALAPCPADRAALHEIPVCYDGEDLAEIAARRGLRIEEVVALHSAPVYEVAMLGFSPGFPYLTGLDPRLHAPRRAVPRARVPAGSIAVGGGHTGIYSIESPGGWNLIGTTSLRIFDPSRREPDDEAMFLLRPGDLVKFLPVT